MVVAVERLTKLYCRRTLGSVWVSVVSHFLMHFRLAVVTQRGNLGNNGQKTASKPAGAQFLSARASEQRSDDKVRAESAAGRSGTYSS